MRYKITLLNGMAPLLLDFKDKKMVYQFKNVLKVAIESLFQEKSVLYGAGRTDSKESMQLVKMVAHFDITTKELDTYSIKTGSKSLS